MKEVRTRWYKELDDNVWAVEFRWTQDGEEKFYSVVTFQTDLELAVIASSRYYRKLEEGTLPTFEEPSND